MTGSWGLTVYIDLVEELPLLLYASDSTLSRVIGAMGSRRQQISHGSTCLGWRGPPEYFAI